MLSSNFARQSGITAITWEQFGELCRQLAVRASPYAPDAVVGIARGGWLPATVLACILRCELYPMRLSRREGERRVHQVPQILLPPPAQVAGRRVLLVDEIADTGTTLALGVRSLKRAGVAELRTATLVAHSWASPRPDFVALETDAGIINPWDREVIEDGVLVTRPDIAVALGGREPGGR